MALTISNIKSTGNDDSEASDNLLLFCHILARNGAKWGLNSRSPKMLL